MINLVPTNNQMILDEEDQSIESTIVSSTAPSGQNKRICRDGDAVMSTTKRPGGIMKKRKSPRHDNSQMRKMKILDRSFTPGNFDVICARGSDARNHPGNVNLRRKIMESSEAYTSAPSKLFKSSIVSSIVEWVRSQSPDGGFVKRMEDGLWYEVGDALAREKVGQALRDRNHTHYKSSMKAKRRRWKQQKEEQELLQPPEPVTSSVEVLSDEEMDTAVKVMLQSHQDMIERSLQLVEAKWREYGGEDCDDDDKLLNLFTCHNRFLLRTLKADKTAHANMNMVL